MSEQVCLNCQEVPAKDWDKRWCDSCQSHLYLVDKGVTKGELYRNLWGSVHQGNHFEDGKLYMNCGRCKDEMVVDYARHPDGETSFYLHCTNCSWFVSIYRGKIDEHKKVVKALQKYGSK